METFLANLTAVLNQLGVLHRRRATAQIDSRDCDWFDNIKVHPCKTQQE